MAPARPPVLGSRLGRHPSRQARATWSRRVAGQVRARPRLLRRLGTDGAQRGLGVRDEYALRQESAERGASRGLRQGGSRGHAPEGSSPLLKGLYMSRGRTTSLTIRLTPAERLTLLTWQRSTTISAGLARRSRIILLLADRMPITDIAATVGVSRRFVYRWAKRFVQERLEGLADKPGRGHPGLRLALLP